MSLWCLQFPPKNKERKSTRGIIVVITNLFVCFLEEKLTWKNPFDFAGPLTGRQKNWQYLPVVSMFIYQTTVDFVKKKICLLRKLEL